MALPLAPTDLPAELTGLIAEFGKAWASSVHQPVPEPAIRREWDDLLLEWSNAVDLPLLIRKHRNDRGFEVQHESGRIIVPTDNSAAHWSFTLACAGIVPTLRQVGSLFLSDEIPVVMIQKSVEKATAKYHCTLKKDHDVGRSGWKLAHIRPVGMNSRTALKSLPISKLKEQFRGLLAPSNMFVIPSGWSGLAEVTAVIEAVAAFRANDASQPTPKAVGCSGLFANIHTAT